MKKERFVEDAEPYKLCSACDTYTTFVGDGLRNIPKNHFAAAFVI